MHLAKQQEKAHLFKSSHGLTPWLISLQIIVIVVVHLLCWKRQHSRVALVPFPIPRRPRNPLHVLPVHRECSLLIRSMIIAQPGGPDRSLSQQLGSHQSQQAHRGSPLKKHRLVLIYSLEPLRISAFFFFFVLLDRKGLNINRKKKHSMKLLRGCWLKTSSISSPHSRLIWLISHLVHREYFN